MRLLIKRLRKIFGSIKFYRENVILIIGAAIIAWRLLSPIRHCSIGIFNDCYTNYPRTILYVVAIFVITSLMYYLFRQGRIEKL